MILLDTSVVVDALHPRNAALRERFDEVQGAICGITRAEVLQGARDPVEAEKLRAALDAYPRYRLPEMFGTCSDDTWPFFARRDARPLLLMRSSRRWRSVTGSSSGHATHTTKHSSSSSPS